MTEKVFNLRNMVDAVNIDSFYTYIAESVGLEEGIAGYDAGKGKFPVKLCLLNYSTLKVTWDEDKFPELRSKLASSLSNLVQHEPAEIAAGAEPDLTVISPS